MAEGRKIVQRISGKLSGSAKGELKRGDSNEYFFFLPKGRAS